MKKRRQILAFLLGLSLLVCGCTKTPTNDGETLNQTVNTTNKDKNEHQSKLDMLRPVAYSTVEGLNLEPGSYISIIGRYSGDSYWKEVEAGAKRAVSDINSMLGYKGDNKIKLSYSSPDIRDDVDEQINILDEELGRYPVAIGIATIDTTACSVQFDLAAENGIPIVTMDSGSDYQDIVAHISTDNVEAAQTAASNLAALMGNSGDVLIITQDSVSMTAQQRTQGFINAMTNISTDINIADIYHMDQLKEISAALAVEQNAELMEEDLQVDPASFSQEDIVAYYIEKHPDLKAIYATNLDTTQLVADVVTAMDRTDLLIVGFDGGEDQMKLLENDVVNGLVIQNPYAIGYATIVAAARTVLDLGNEAYIDSGYTWVTKGNMTLPEIQKILY